ncbi:hypothetical protein TSUD_265870, partial [Trifolium subterraneum]
MSSFVISRSTVPIDVSYILHHLQERKTRSVRSSINDSSFNPSNGTNGRTRIIRVIQEFRTKLAFSTVIGQTGDWDILSAGLAVVVVEGIGAL